MSKFPTPISSESSGTRGTGTMIFIEATTPPCGLNVIPEINNIRQSTTPDLRKSNKLDTSIDQQFTNNLVAPPIFTELFCDKISNIYSWDLFTRFWMNPAAYPVNIPAPQFVDLGISTINALDKGASICTPSTRVGRPTDVAHWSSLDRTFGKTTAVGDAVSAKSDYNYKPDNENWR